jgi:Tol biopolymer transport system component
MKFSSLAVLSLVVATATSDLAAQTAPKDSTDKKATPVTYSVSNARAMFGMDAEPPADNSQIQFATQFAGALAIKPEPGQDFLDNIQQLTFGGENLAPSFSPDGRRIIFEARSFNGVTCPQIFSMTIDGKDAHRMSTGKGEAQWANYSPKGERIIYTSTHAMLNGQCPPPVDPTLVNPISINGLHDLYVADSSGKILSAVTEDHKVYDGMASISPDNKKIVFTSTRSGDVDLFVLDLGKNELKQLTADEGFEGFARFSPDGSKIVFSASRVLGKDVNAYRKNLMYGNVDLVKAEIFIMDADGSNMRQLTANGALNAQPIFSPNGESVVFASNMHDTTRKDMAIFAMKLSGGEPVMCLNSAASEQYPMFSADGRKFLFVSDYGAKSAGEKNIFIADWKH